MLSEGPLITNSYLDILRFRAPHTPPPPQLYLRRANIDIVSGEVLWGNLNSNCSFEALSFYSTKDPENMGPISIIYCVSV
jgi:hypothetical protein